MSSAQPAFGGRFRQLIELGMVKVDMGLLDAPQPLGSYVQNMHIR